MKAVKLVLTILVLWPMYFLLKAMPRSNTIWCFSSYRDSFVDNSKYLFHYVSMYHPEITCYWVTDDLELISDLKNQGYQVCKRKSLQGAWIIIRAKCVFYSSYVSEINFWLTSGAKLINLWHGLPLKKIEFDIDSGVLQKKYSTSLNAVNLKHRFFYPSAYRKADLMFAPSDSMQDIFSSAFRISQKHILRCGSPRTDQFFDCSSFKALEVSDDIHPGERRIYIYMPTFRDTGGEFFSNNNFDFAALNKLMNEQDAEFWIKAHPSAGAAELDLSSYDKIKLLPSNLDMYPVLKNSYALITDYSSIYIDYLLLDKPIFFYCFDLNDYQQNCRSMYFDYADCTPGAKSSNFNELLLSLDDNSDNFISERNSVKTMFWGNEYQPACKSLTNHILKTFIKDKL